jgi:hypothetical protein
LIPRVAYILTALGLTITLIEGQSRWNAVRGIGLVATNNGLVSNERSEVAVKGTYSNYDYAFSVRIPKGMVGYRSAAPKPNHGFVIRRATGTNEISVFANYNASEWRSFGDVTQAHLRSFKQETSGDCKLLKQTPTMMGGLKALRFVIRSTPSGASKPMILDSVVAFRKVPGEVGIVYEISLTTPESALSRGDRLLRLIQQGFRQRPLPKDDPVRRK